MTSVLKPADKKFWIPPLDTHYPIFVKITTITCCIRFVLHSWVFSPLIKSNIWKLLPVLVVYGSCMPTLSCGSSLCDSLTSQSLSQGLSPGSNFSFVTCESSCCDGNLCNHRTIQQTVAPNVFPTAPSGNVNGSFCTSSFRCNCVFSI